MGWRDAAFNFGAVAVLVSSLWIPSARAGNTTCASRQMDWYSSVVGESPCATYERLRQICNPDYQVPDFLPAVPGDRCNDQVSACCCNSVAFQLSMLCKNCQYVKEDGAVVGYDAAPGSYLTYRGTCGQGTNHSLPGDVQQAVCNKDIRLDNFLYGGWDDGAWFYVYTKENAVKEHAANNDNTFTHCANQISPSVTPTPTATTTDDQNNSKTDSPPTTTTTGPSDPTGTTHTTEPGHTSETTGTTSTTSPTGTTGSAGVPTGLTDNGNDKNDAGTATTQESSSATGLTAQNSTSTSKHSNLSAIVGGVIGGIGAIALILAAVVFWKIRRSDSAKKHVPPDHAYPYPYRDDSYGSPMSLATPFGASMGQTGRPMAPSPSPPPSAMGSSAALATRTSVSRTRSMDSSPGSHDTFVFPSPQPTMTTTSPDFYDAEDPYRHEDGGPVVQLVRSPSGRLPPAYRSWEQAPQNRRRPSDFPQSVSDAVSQVSEPQVHASERQGYAYLQHTPSASQSTTTAPSTAPPSVPALPSEKAGLYGTVPLAPMRRVDEW